MRFISLFLCAKFEGNLITRLHFMAFFVSVHKEEKEKNKAKKKNDFLKAHISGMAGTIYFRFCMCSLSICRHLHSEFGLN